MQVLNTSQATPGPTPSKFHFISCSNHIAAGEDYVESVKSILFAPGFGLVQCVHIPVLDDECLEYNLESFNVSLNSSLDCVQFGVMEAMVYIEDDDGNIYVIIPG